MSVSAVAGALALIYPLAESIVHEFNSKKANQKRKELDQVLARFNLKLDDLRKQLELKGIDYNQLMDKLAYTSPVGKAHKIKQSAEKEYRSAVDTINSKIADTTEKMNQYSAIENKGISDIESRGVVRTILGD